LRPGFLKGGKVARNRVIAAGVVVIACVFAVFHAGRAAATAGSMSCGTQYSANGSYACTWGFNYMGPSTNEIVTGTNNYWQHEDWTKNSGGTVYLGFGPSGCHTALTGTSSGTISPSQIGCGGYINPFAQYAIGFTSYLQFFSRVY
jgi:hypothetical protein